MAAAVTLQLNQRGDGLGRFHGVEGKREVKGGQAANCWRCSNSMRKYSNIMGVQKRPRSGAQKTEVGRISMKAIE